MDTFEVTREDNCIWIQDLRVPQELEAKCPGIAVKHVVPEQAAELMHKLRGVMHEVKEWPWCNIPSG